MIDMVEGTRILSLDRLFFFLNRLIRHKDSQGGGGQYALAGVSLPLLVS
jgi:hypothetical protein